MKNNLEELQSRLKINFENRELLNIAITHSSYANEKRNVKYNERLEFLGDSVLQLIITEHLFTLYKNKTEGELSKKRALIVCENSLFEVSKEWNLGNYINMSKGEELTGGRTRTSILADCVEAIIAAIYLDRGFEIVKEFVLDNFKNIVVKAMKDEIIMDYKTKLQEKLQEHGEVNIEYDLLKFEGPPHRRKFYMNVRIDKKILGEGVGYSKKEAEQKAAKEAIVKLEDEK